MDLLAKKKGLILIVAIAIALLGYYIFVGQAEPKQEATNALFTEMEQEKETVATGETEEIEAPVVMKVDVKGAVREPGVFIAEPGDRVIDVIAEAGDFTKEADLDQVNLAQLVEDQMVIYVPTIGEEATDISAIGSASVEGVVAISGSNHESSGQVNLNTATQAELETLTGVGPAKALAIIDYRETTGKFQQIEDLKNISGIGDKTFEKLKDSITVK